MSTILEQFQQSLDSLGRAKTKVLEVRSRVLPYANCLEAMKEEFQVSFIPMHDYLIVSKSIKAMNEIVPVLEAIEELTGCDFDQTEDYSTFRAFKSTSYPWIRVDAEISVDENAKCRRVPTGEFDSYVTPRYKIVCE